jgi:von Willebrand factor type A domain
MTLVISTHLSGRRPLGVGSQQVIDGYPQLVRVIESRLGSEDARLFARPERRSDPSWIDWHSTYEGPVIPLGELPAERRAAVEAAVSGALARISTLAESLQKGDGSARFFGDVLARAATNPGPDSIYLVGEHPVLVLWGFEPEARIPVFVPPTAPAMAGATDLGALAVGPAAGQGWWAALWRWLLLLLMLALLILLLLRSCTPLAPLVVERQDKAPDLTGDIAAAGQDADRRAEELKSLQALRDRQLATCILPTPPPTVPAQIEPAFPPVTPPKVAETPPAKPPKLPPLAALPPLPAIPKTKPPQIAAKPPDTTSPTTTKPKPASCVPQRMPHDAPEVVMVVDGSGSMGEQWGGTGSRLDAAKRSIGQFVDGLPGDVDVALIEFGGCNDIQRDSFYSPSQRGVLKGRVNGLQPRNGTPLGLSVERAGRIISSKRPGIIVVVSDGADTCRGDPCAAAQAIAAAKPNVHINVISIGGETNNAAQCMAQSTGGHVYQPGNAIEMERAIRQASGEPDVRLCQ